MNSVEKQWYRITPLHLLLWPLSLLLGLSTALRRTLYRYHLLSSFRAPVTIIIVGNISVGGTGKTPFTLWLAQQLVEQGWHPAIISRGYTQHKTAIQTPHAVVLSDTASDVGDEPLLMAQRDVCPVWIGRNRPVTVKALLQAHPECDVILSDDGLQHYRLQRDIEIVLVDGQRRFGNGLLLPAGPLREPVSRLKTVDFVVNNGGIKNIGEYAMQLDGSQFYNLLNPATVATVTTFAGLKVHAIAGIGHPQRFFSHLKKMGLSTHNHAFPDHHHYRETDLNFKDADAILMTEKDAVKCAAFATEQCWVLRVDAQVDPTLLQLILDKIKK